LSGLLKRKNIIIVGFMGTGKSTVSRLLSEKLGWPRLDTDEEIVRIAGKKIPDIFADEGEAGFRDRESRVLEDILAGDRQIVATGGGAVLREENRRRMLAGGWVVALTASRQSLLERVTAAGAAGTRPLLAGDAEERNRFAAGDSQACLRLRACRDRYLPQKPRADREYACPVDLIDYPKRACRRACLPSCRILERPSTRTLFRCGFRCGR
jgi:Shikimate kinase